MSGERWDDLEAAFHELAPLPPERRTALLERLATTDPALAAELGSLLAAHTSEGALEGLRGALGLDRLRELTRAGELAGTRLGAYQVHELLARGGMGEVYRAVHEQLGREVALKTLPRSVVSQPAARERFLREARAAARLDHTNICALLEVGETGDGRPFLVMPLYAGETLEQRLARGPFELHEALELAAQAARGLAAAHERGIVHRDIKPSNLLLTADGGLRILDFGVARLDEGDLTAPEERLGTRRYMAPEQLAGTPVDGRADLWALGLVLQQMLTGRYHPGLLPAGQRDALPAPLLQLLRRLLQPEPADRWPDAASLVPSLAALARDPGGRSLRRRRLAGATLMTAAALVLTGLIVVVRPDGGPSLADAEAPPSSLEPAVAVLPFQAAGLDSEFWREGIVHLLSFNLEGLGQLRKIDPQAVLEAWSQAGATDAAVAAVGRRTRARFAVTGSAVQHRGSVRLTAAVHDVRAGRVRGSVSVDGRADSILQLLDRLTLELVRQQLLPVDPGHPPVNLGRVTTTSVPALRAYLEGERAYRLAQWDDAVAHFRRAVELDSTFARAMFRLGSAYVWADPTAEYGQAHIERAARFADRLPERDALLLRGRARWDLAALQELTTRYPDDVDGWYHRGDLAFHTGGIALYPSDEFRHALNRAVALSPYYGEPYIHLLEDAFAHRDGARVRELLAAVAANGGGDCPAYQLLHDLTWGQPAQRTAARARLARTQRDDLYCAWVTLATDGDALERMERLDRPLLSDTLPLEIPVTTLWRAVHGRMMRGQLRAARALLDHARTVQALRVDAARFTLMFHLSGFPDPSRLAAAVAVLRESGLPEDHFWLGALAADSGQWNRVEQAASAIEERVRAGAVEGAGDASFAPALRAYAGLLQGADGQLPRLHAALVGTPAVGWRGEFPGKFLRYRTAQLLLEQRRFAEAERYLRAFYHYDFVYFVPAQFQLARLEEQRGQAAAARAGYRLALQWWEQSDPEYEAWRREARAALLRLGEAD